METKNKKELCAYVQPETEIVTIGSESAVMQGINPASQADDEDL